MMPWETSLFTRVWTIVNLVRKLVGHIHLGCFIHCIYNLRDLSSLLSNLACSQGFLTETNKVLIYKISSYIDHSIR